MAIVTESISWKNGVKVGENSLLTCANMTLIKSYIFSIIKVNVYYGGLNHED